MKSKTLEFSIPQRSIRTATQNDIYLMQKMYARENDIAYVDLYNEFKDNDGALKPEYDFGDEFHLSLSGYQVWMNWLKPYLRRIED